MEPGHLMHEKCVETRQGTWTQEYHLCLSLSATVRRLFSQFICIMSSSCSLDLLFYLVIRCKKLFLVVIVQDSRSEGWPTCWGLLPFFFFFFLFVWWKKIRCRFSGLEFSNGCQAADRPIPPSTWLVAMCHDGWRPRVVHVATGNEFLMVWFMKLCFCGQSSEFDRVED